MVFLLSFYLTIKEQFHGVFSFSNLGDSTLQLYDSLQSTNGIIKVFGTISHVFGGTHSYCLINLSATGNFLSSTAFEMDILFGISYTDAAHL